MLKVLKNGERYSEPCSLLLGGFDGFHKGHGTLLEEAKKTGLPAGLTAISGCKSGSDIFTFEERERIFGRIGFSFVCEIEFTERFRNVSAEDFIGKLFGQVNAKAVFCGEDFRFGKGACGTPELLKELAPCPVSVLPLKRAGGEKISASRLKELVKAGKAEELNALLTFPYFICGAVEHGREVGRKIGFPTANLSFGERKLPLGEGVYGGRVETERGGYPAIVNVGARPTFGVAETKIEAHLIGFDGDLYGERICVYPEKFLRPVTAFGSKEELVLQLEKDKRECLHD